MRICVVSGTFHPEIGGPPTYLYHLLPALVERGHEITVVTYGNSTQAFDYPYRVVRVSRQSSIPVRLARLTRQVWRVARNCDLIFVSGYGLPPAFVNLWLRKPLVLKVVSDFAWEFCERHGWVTDSVLPFQVHRYSPRVELVKAVRRWYVNRADRVIVPSLYVAELVKNWGVPERRINVIYNAFRVSTPISTLSKRDARESLGFHNDEALLVTVGRLIPLKRIHWIVRAVQLLHDVRLIIVGDGPSRPSLEGFVVERGMERKIEFVGQVPQGQVPLYLRAADAFVLSSETEGFPHVILEAMAVGTPVVATAVGGVPELVQHEKSGLLVSPYSEVELKEQIGRVLSDSALAQRMASYSLEEIVPLFSWNRLERETEWVLCEMVKGQSL